MSETIYLINQITNEFEYKNFLLNLGEEFDYHLCRALLIDFSINSECEDKISSIFFFVNAIVCKYGYNINKSRLHSIMTYSFSNFLHWLQRNPGFKNIDENDFYFKRIISICQKNPRLLNTFKEASSYVDFSSKELELFFAFMNDKIKK